jgi:hypothetical protein
MTEIENGLERALYMRPTIAAILVDPAASHALKRVICDWLARDCVDAAHDARALCQLFEDRADQALGRLI